jgi:glutamate-ammonia-ligase adenylyltransferase
LRHAAARPDILDPHPAEMLRRAAAIGLLAGDDCERLLTARRLLADVQSLLRLTLDSDESAFDEGSAPEGQRRLIATTEGAVDLADLQARIARETQAARVIYGRTIEDPARAAGWQARGERRSEG